MECKIVTTRRNPEDTSEYSGSHCMTCKKQFQDGDSRYVWRMYLPANKEFVKYFRGSFVTEHCRDCYIETLTIWKNSMQEALEEIV
jgi:hypothetical protein